jgi:hypothetical protein
MYYDWEPKHNNFCSYWRATMFRVLFAGILGIVGIYALTGFGVVVYHHPIDSLIIFGSTIGFFAFVVGGTIFWQYLSDRKETNTNKSKICPMVEYD